MVTQIPYAQRAHGDIATVMPRLPTGRLPDIVPAGWTRISDALAYHIITNPADPIAEQWSAATDVAIVIIRGVKLP